MPILPLLLAFSFVAHQTPEPPARNRALPQRLRGLPVGILVLHHPNPCYPRPEGSGFVWKHDTAVQSLVGDLELVEYGAYVYGAAGWTLRATMTPSDFAKAYRCRDARLRGRRVYTDPDNARYGDKPTAGDALWFFLAKDAKGKIYKGTALVETEGEVLVSP